MDALRAARRVVVKIGSALLVEAGGLREDWLLALARDIAMLRRSGAEVIVVSSGSIALGRGVLRLGDKPLPLEQSQASAAVGQIRLARAYEAALAPHGIAAAQVLLTLDDSHDRRRYLNTRATLQTLLSMGVVPIVNENDTIATDEIRFGDNDRLAAQVAVTVAADMLVLLSDIDGLYTADPARDRNAQRIGKIETITPEIEAMAGDAGSGLSKGGMKTKVLAAKMATAVGCGMVIAKGWFDAPLAALLEGGAHSYFVPQGDPQDARKGWINSMMTRGQITVDAGAARALKAGNSLLPAGVLAVSGDFERGECVSIHGPDGKLGQGLARYSAEEAQAIRGAQSRDIEARLGYPGRAALVHRDDMAV